MGILMEIRLVDEIKRRGLCLPETEMSEHQMINGSLMLETINGNLSKIVIGLRPNIRKGGRVII